MAARSAQFELGQHLGGVAQLGGADREFDGETVGGRAGLDTACVKFLFDGLDIRCLCAECTPSAILTSGVIMSGSAGVWSGCGYRLVGIRCSNWTEGADKCIPANPERKSEIARMSESQIYPELSKRLAETPAVALLGPRQVGKTTLAQIIAETRPSIYLDRALNQWLTPAPGPVPIGTTYGPSAC